MAVDQNVDPEVSDQPVVDVPSPAGPSPEPPPTKRRFSTVWTVIFSVGFFGALIGQNVYVAVTGPTSLLDRPIEAALRVQEHALDRDPKVLPQAIASYQESLVRAPVGPAAEPGMNAVLARRLAIALAEAGRLEEAVALSAKTGPAEASDDFWTVLRFAYGPPTVAPAAPALAGALAALQAPDGRALGTGWAVDALTARYHARTGDQRAAAEARARQQDWTAAGSRRRAKLPLGLLPGLAGALLLVRQLVRRQRLPELSTGFVQPPWTLGEGYAIFLRCGVQAVLMLFVLAFVVVIAQAVAKAFGKTPSPPPWGLFTLPAGGAVILYLRRALLRPHATTLAAAFGLSRVRSWRGVVSATMIIPSSATRPRS